MGWGTGDDAARARRQTLTLTELTAMGLTANTARQWRDFYTLVKQQVPGNPSAAGRADLMQFALELLEA